MTPSNFIILACLAIVGAIFGPRVIEHFTVQARLSEAKVALGGLYTAETAFFSEHGVYGNNLPKIGFELEEKLQAYYVGFPREGVCVSSKRIQPADRVLASSIRASIPDYYESQNFRSLYGPTDRNDAHYCLKGELPDEGNQFLATASGRLRSRNTDASDPTHVDQWSIDHNGTLRHVNDPS